MVRIIAELSINMPTASSGDRYKYRYGCGYGGGSGYKERQQIIYKRPALVIGEKKSEKQQSTMDSNNGGEGYEGFNDYQSNIINSRIDAINEQSNHINNMIATHRDMREKQQMREKCGNSEKEKEKEETTKGAKVINPKLGKIIYRSRTGELFFAQHSVQLTTTFVFDKKTGQSTQSQTQKIVWNDKVFETKQDWFSEMARLCIDQNMKVVRCE
jgi:hypothetical protein